MGLEEEVQEISRLRKSASVANDEERERLESLRQSIISGETTGDRIKDFVIVSYRKIDEALEEPYRMLEESLQGKEGQQILAVREDIKTSQREGGCFGIHEDVSVDSLLRLGILNGEIGFEIGDGHVDVGISSNYTGPRVIISTEAHVRKEDGLEWELHEGNIEIPMGELIDFNPEKDINGNKTIPQGLLASGNGFGNYITRPLINVGDENVLNYFDENKFSIFGARDLSYVRAADMLGIRDRLPQDFVQEYDQKIYDGKVSLIHDISELVSEDRKLGEKIKKIQGKIGTTYEDERSDGMTMTLPFDESYAESLASPVRRRQERIKESIRNNLERATNIGLHQTDWVLEDEVTPERTLDVPEYISRLCQDYDVKTEN